MIIDRIVLHNFGLYAGHQEIELTPPSRERPVVLIGGMNGGGKTTLLDALHLAFYGPSGQCAGRGNQAYKAYLQAMIHRGADPGEWAGVEVVFRRVVDGKWKEIVLKRSWHVARGRVEETVDVQADGEPDPILSEHWMEYIENYLPAKLAGLFYFDGEQIARMAEDEHAAGILETALNSLLGLDLVERLKNDLSVLARQHRKKHGTADERKKMTELDAEWKAAQAEWEKAAQEPARLQGLLGRFEKELADLKESFRKEGGELYERREQLEQARESASLEVEKLEEELRELAAGPAPLLLAKKCLEEVERQVNRELEAGRQQILAEAEAERDARIVKALGKQKLSADVMALIRRTLEEHRPTRDTADMEMYLHPTPELAEELRRLREVALPRTRDVAAGLLKKLQAARERKARAEEQLGAVPTADAIGKLQGKLQKAEERVRETELAFRVAEEKTRQCQVDVAAKERAWQNAMGAAAQNEEFAEDQRRISTRIPKVQATLEAFRQRVVAQRASQFERLILESFRQLLRKTRLVEGIHIDPKSYQIGLTGGDGKPLAFTRLSAGERQLLATAILWGISKASGRPVPLVIDTPLGRLDSTHRGHLVDRYFPAASHQVILLSTDKEIIDEELDVLRPYIGREYCLVHEEKHNSTTVKQGYFEQP